VASNVLLELLDRIFNERYKNVDKINKKAQLPLTNPRDAKRESMPKIVQIRRAYTTLSLTIGLLVYLHSFSCCCVQNLRNPKKVSENSNL